MNFNTIADDNNMLADGSFEVLKIRNYFVLFVIN